MSLQLKPQEEEEEEEKKNSSPPSSPPSSTPSFSSLPDEIIVNCLAWIPRSYYPRLSVVSKTFHSILSSTELYAVRSQLGSTEQYLYVCLWDYDIQDPEWFRLLINPNQTLPNSCVTKKKKTIGQLLVPIPPPNYFHDRTESTVVVGSEIYGIGGPLDQARSSAVRVLDCRTHTWRYAPSMIAPRTKALTCVYGGKIYVMGGWELLEDEPWAEVFDTKTQTWECLPDPGTEVRKVGIPEIKAMEGKIYVGDVYGDNLYAYDTRQGKWECCENENTAFLWSQCVMENVTYHYLDNSVWWYDIKVRFWKTVEGLDSLEDKLRRKGGAEEYNTKLVSFGGKLLLTWEGLKNRKKRIWCAAIVMEKRDGDEVWGTVEWVHVVHTAPESCLLSHCLAVSV